MIKFEQAFISDRAGLSIVDFLADELSLSKAKIKEAVTKGGVWSYREGEEPQRQKQVKAQVKLGDEIHIYYDEALLAYRTPRLDLIADFEQYSIWSKPAGLMPELTLYADHLSLEVALDKSLPKDLDCHFVLPIQAELEGLVVIAHSRNAAARFDALQQRGGIHCDVELSCFGKMAELNEGVDQWRGLDGSIFDLCPIPENCQINERAWVRIVQEVQGAEDLILGILEEQMLEANLDDYQDRFELSCVKMSFVCPITAEKRVFSLA